MTARKNSEEEQALIPLTSQNMSGETEPRKQWPCKRMATVALSCAITIGVVCAYSAGDRAHGINMYETVDLALSGSQRWFEYSYVSDVKEARFVKPKFKIFDYNNNDFQAIYSTESKTEYFTESSLSKTSSKLSTSYGLDASYGAFSGSIEVSATSSSAVEKRQMMAIFQSRAKIFKIIGSRLNPADRLREDVRKLIVESSSDKIIERLGEFYATAMDFGGIIRTIFRQTQTSSDEYSKFAVEVTAQATALTASVNMKGGVSNERSLTDSHETVRVTVTTQGGDSHIWLSGSDFKRNQAEWAKSFKKDGSNSLPIGFKLVPIWNIVKKIDLAKGNAVESKLKKKWKSAEDDLKELDDTPLKPVPNNARVYIKAIGRDSKGRNSVYWMAKNPSGTYCSVASTDKNLRAAWRVTYGDFQGRPFIRLTYDDESTNNYLYYYKVLYASTTGSAKFDTQSTNTKQLWVLDNTLSTALNYETTVRFLDRYVFSYLAVNTATDASGYTGGGNKVWVEAKYDRHLNSNFISHFQVCEVGVC